jgi:hypothetical protein
MAQTVKKTERDPVEVAAIIADIYNQNFAEKGWYQISWDDYKFLLNRKRLHPIIIGTVADILSEDFELIQVTLDESFIILDESTLLNLKEAPDDWVKKYLKFPSKNTEVKIGDRIKKQFNGQWFEGTIKNIYGNNKIFVIYDDEDYEVTSIDEVVKILG